MIKERGRLFDRLAAGLSDGIEHERGARALQVTVITVPDPPRCFTADEVRLIRSRYGMSQAGFARLLYVSPKTVQSWEQGTRRPRQSAARLLQFIERPELLAGCMAPHGAR